MSELKFPNISSIVQSGRLTRDPDIKHLEQTTVANVSIAFSKNYKKGDEWIEKTGYADVTAWSNLADRCADLHKGDPVIIEGALDYESWQTKEGQTRSKLFITAKSIKALSKSEERIETEEYAHELGDVDETIPSDSDVPF